MSAACTACIYFIQCLIIVQCGFGSRATDWAVFHLAQEHEIVSSCSGVCRVTCSDGCPRAICFDHCTCCPALFSPSVASVVFSPPPPPAPPSRCSAVFRGVTKREAQWQWQHHFTAREGFSRNSVQGICCCGYSCGLTPALHQTHAAVSGMQVPFRMLPDGQQYTTVSVSHLWYMGSQAQAISLCHTFDTWDRRHRQSGTSMNSMWFVSQ